MDAPRSLDALAARYDGKIRAFLQTVTALGPADLEDMVQDVYLRFHKYNLLDRYAKDRSAFTSYLFLVCQSVARNRHRAVTRRPVLQGSDKLERSYRVPRAAPATQEDEVFVAQLRAYLEAQPEMQPIIERVERTGRMTARDKATLLDGLRPVLA